MRITTQNNQDIYSLRNFRMLLADDYDFIRNMVLSMLKAFGVGHVTACSSGQQAIEIMRINHAAVSSGTERPFDIILTDWMMPDGSGQDLIKWIRNHPSDQIRFMPVMMLSTFASARTVMTARDCGANEILVKPVSAQKVASRILSIIDNPRPYVKAISFFGPDRRRKDRAPSGEDRRRADASHIIQHTEHRSEYAGHEQVSGRHS
ncbi:MAG TPA: response regulator [Micavibrio sp.]|jgi:CheY-like chemotaxis protein